MKRFEIFAMLATVALSVAAETVLFRREGVQISDDGLTTIPPNSIATPAQIGVISNDTAETRQTSEALQAEAETASAAVEAARAKTYLYSTNYVVTSTVYVQSIGGVPYDPSNQLIRCPSVSLTPTSVVIVATVKQQPLVTPVLDWRQSLQGGAWTNATATVTAIDVPEGVTNAAAAYRFDVARGTFSNAFFRVVDNSTGASGSGLFWLVYGGIFVDGKRGMYGTLTNVCGSTTNVYLLKGGIIVEPDPL